MMKLKLYQTPVTEQICFRQELNFCLSGDIPSNSIADYELIEDDDIDWDTN